MARTSVSWETLRELAGFRGRADYAISFYVDLDPGATPTASDLKTRTRALIDEVHKQAEAARERRTHEEQRSIRADIERIDRYIRDEFERDGVRGLAVFAAALDDLWRPLPLSASVPDTVKLGADLHVAPLVELAGDGAVALVAVVDRERGDLYELLDGRLEPVSSRFEEQPRRHDQGGWSQARFQRHADELTDRHLRGVAEDLEHELRRRHKTQLVVAGPEEARAEFLDLLSADARAVLAGAAHAEAHASASALLESVRPVLERRRAELEGNLVARWHDALGQSGRATAGWGPTVEAASDGRVECLLYEPRADHAAWRCPRCGRLQVEDGACPLDGTALERCTDGLDALVHKTLEWSGTASVITTRPDLGPVGGVGSLLRF